MITNISRTLFVRAGAKHSSGLLPATQSSSSILRFQAQIRYFASPTAADAYKKSCYFDMDFTIPEDATVFEAVQKFSAYDVGALVTVDKSGKSNPLKLRTMQVLQRSSK